MCLAIPGRIESLIDANTAFVNMGGVAKAVNTDLVDNPHVGDWVIVHVGFALNRIDEDEAQRTLAALKEAGAIEDDLEDDLEDASKA